ncbi:MAG: lipopolysaccharide biosynthesis protein [Pseudorhodoplanes sp.]
MRWTDLIDAQLDALRSAARHRLARNVIANYAGSLISALVPLMALPFLLRALGSSYWGLVSFATLMVTVMALFNAGIAQSMVREFGTRWIQGLSGRQAAARLLYGYERIYWLSGLAIALLVWPFSDLVVSHWLDIGAIPGEVALGVVYAAIVLFVVQLPAALYGAALTALGEQVRLNFLRSLFTIAKGVSGVMVASQTQNVLAYLTILVLASFLETVSMAWNTWKLMPETRSSQSWDRTEVQSALRPAVTMSALVMLAVLTTQLDKLFVSLKLPIEQLGTYAIAYSIAMGALQVSYPIFNAMLPRLVEIGGNAYLRRITNLRLLLIVSAIITGIACVYVLVGRSVLELWLGDQALALRVAGVLDWLLLSSALNTVYNIGYTNWVSLGNTRWIAAINIASFLIALSLAPVMIETFGLSGAAFSLVAINLIGCAATLVWLFLKDQTQVSVLR